MQSIQIHSQLSFQEYLRANFRMTYHIPFIGLLTILGFSSLLFFLKDIGDFHWENGQKPLLQLFFGLYVLALMPLVIYFKTRKAFKTKSRSTERMNWTFDHEWVSINAESFETKMTWDKVHSVLETKDVFFIYQTKFMANIISKRNLNQEQLVGFRNLVKEVLGLKHRLRID